MRKLCLSRRATALFLLATGLAACGGSSDPGVLTDGGYVALGTGDYTGAREHFQAALEHLQPTDPRYVRAKMGEIEALIQSDASEAKEQFLALAASRPDAIGAKEYDTVATKMVAAKKFVPAIELLDAGVKAHAEDPRLKPRLDEVKLAAEKDADPKEILALRSIGYLN